MHIEPDNKGLIMDIYTNIKFIWLFTKHTVLLNLKGRNKMLVIKLFIWENVYIVYFACFGHEIVIL